MPKELQSSLDGPKWVSSSSRHSRSKNVSAPIKPKPQFRQQSGLGSSARRLFPTQPDRASDTVIVRPASDTELRGDDATADSSSVGDENESDWLSTVADDGDDATPRPSRSASLGHSRSVSREHSFFSDFVPQPPVPGLVNDVCTVVNAVTRKGVSLASALVTGAPSSPSLSGSADTPPPFSSPQFSSPPASPPSPPPLPPSPPPPSPPSGMATVLPLAKDINVKDVKDFDGSPANLSMFDTQIENALDRWDIPAYYGGCVSGDVQRGFEFVPSPGGQSNYRLGGKLCSGLCNKLTGAAAQWWDDYAKSGKPRPNCWKKATDASFIPDGVVEVSLYDLLMLQFDPTIDAQQAELELDRYRWNPLDKKALGVVPFRGHVSRLCTRAGKTGWALRGNVIRNTFPDWLKRKVNVTKTEDAFWSSVEESVNTEMMDRQRSEDRPSDKDNRNERRKDSRSDRAEKKCIFCGYNGHEVADCRKMKAARANLPARNDSSAGATQSSNGQQSSPASSGGNSKSDRRTPTCYNCHKQGHISTFCPEPKRDRKAANELPANVTAGSDAPIYLSVPSDSFANRIPSSAPVVAHVLHDEKLDEKDVILVGNQKLELPLYHALSQVRERKEVFAFNPPSPEALRPPSSVMHSYALSPGGQQLLTIWDTAALLSMVPMSTVRALNLSYTPGSDVSFVVANGSKMSPLGYCSDMQFSFPDDARRRMYHDRVYVVESAPFQLLLGVRFLHRHWAGIFIPGAAVVLMKPTYLQIQGSLVRPSGSQPLHSEVVDDLRLASADTDGGDDGDLAGSADDFSGSADLLVTVPTPLRVGHRDLVAELDGPVSTDFAATAKVSRDFVRGIIKFGPCPESIIDRAIDLVLQHWDQFSWHEMDLGCISDVPYDTQYVDNSPCVCKSRRHNYAERNATVIEAKSRPLIDLGVYKRAGPEVVDRAQLVVVRTKPDEPMNPKYCRVAHDFRCKNDKALQVPVPLANRPELYSFLTKFKYFWKTDADRGFLQVQQAPGAIRHTGFELFHELYVSERMLFGQINGPSFFELNFNVMAQDLKFKQKVVKNFFDDILGGGNSWDELLLSWAQLLRQAQRHGWKFKPAKTEFGFEEIVAVGAHYNGREGTISMINKLVDAVRALRYPRSVTEVRSLLGLFNQFRDRVPGYALRVHALTQLTRLKGSITMTVEAAEEFRAMQDYLVSPAVLVVFRHGWKTFVYTDASLGSPSTPGGLGAVITQLNPANGKEYVCAFASAGLTPA